MLIVVANMRNHKHHMNSLLVVIALFYLFDLENEVYGHDNLGTEGYKPNRLSNECKRVRNKKGM